MKRSFTVTEVSTIHGTVKGEKNLGGHFVNSTPVEAAKKAASKICAMSKIHGRCALVITVRETTRDSKNKEYTYRVKRVKNVQKIQIDDKEVTFKYNVVAESLNKPKTQKKSKKDKMVEEVVVVEAV
jgi:hypothetical protein